MTVGAITNSRPSSKNTTTGRGSCVKFWTRRKPTTVMLPDLPRATKRTSRQRRHRLQPARGRSLPSDPVHIFDNHLVVSEHGQFTRSSDSECAVMFRFMECCLCYASAASVSRFRRRATRSMSSEEDEPSVLLVPTDEVGLSVASPAAIA